MWHGLQGCVFTPGSAPCPTRAFIAHCLQGLVRVYTKKVGHKPDFGDPVVLR